MPLWTPSSLATAVTEEKKYNPANMTLENKLHGAMMHARKHMGEELWEQIKDFFSPTSLGIMATFTTAWAISHFFGAGEAADAVLLVVGYAALGAQAIPVGTEMYKFAIGVNNARSDAELEEPGKHFAAALIVAGVAVVSAIMFLKRPKLTFRSPETVNIDARIGYEPARTPGLRYTPKVDFKVMKPNLAGETTAWGDIWLNVLHSPEVQEAALYHERVHSFFTPKLYFLREVRVRLNTGSTQYSYLLQYLEEALSEGYALFCKRQNVIKAISFPMREGYVTLARMGIEASGFLMGTINIGGIPYRVWASMTRPATIPKPVNTDRGRR